MSRRYWNKAWSKQMLRALGKEPDIAIAQEFAALR